MSNQPHHTYDPQDPYDPYNDARTRRYDAQSYDQGGAYGSYDQQQPQQQAQQQHHQQGQGAYGETYGSYDAYAQQPQHPQQQQPQQYQWPTNGGQGYPAQQEEPVTQTWQTPTWDTGTWQQPAVPAEDHGYDASWPGGPLPQQPAEPYAAGRQALPEERPAGVVSGPVPGAAPVPHEPGRVPEPV
ncbi:hypothetical protein HCK01_31650, partial [Streptomyces sp. AA8]|nr:hypothetical protein [Streptomyces telluris]